MTRGAEPRDRSDPAVRAAERFARQLRADRSRRIAAAAALAIAAVLGVAVARPLIGDPGATVGAVVAALVLIATAVVPAPLACRRPSAATELEAIR